MTARSAHAACLRAATPSRGVTPVRVVLTLVLGSLMWLLAAAPPAAAASGQGDAWPGVASQIDDLMTDLVADYDLPGVSVAASKNGRLVVSRAYGHADTDQGTPLGDDMQIHMGSNTKALVTGPAAWLAMHDAGLDPATTPLYGADGVLGTAFDEDIAIGAAATGTPIAWYYDITVQDLYDHRAGFAGSGDTAAAAEMFNTPIGDLTYAQAHKHFLRTKGLLWEPGSAYQYSNHGMGSLTMVVEELSGTSFMEFVASEHLGPRGLASEIEPVYDPAGAHTASPHRYSGGVPVPYTPVHDTTLGAAAGGYRGSSRDLVELMTDLAGDYTPKELDRMGWGASGVTATSQWGDAGTARLTHNGRVSGGTSHVRMTVDGINIAVQTNIDNSQVPLSATAAAIEDLLRAETIPVHYDLWKGCTLPGIATGYAQVARHGIPAQAYQCTFDQLTGAGYRPEWIDAFDSDGVVRFNVVFVPDTRGAWSAFHGLDGAQYQQRFDTLVREGYRPGRVDSYVSNGQVRYAGYFIKRDGGAFVAYHGLSASAHQERFDDLVSRGFRPTSLSVVSPDGRLRYTAVYEQGLPGGFLVKSQLTPAGYQTLFDEQLRRGRRPVYLNGYTHDGSPRLVAIFSSVPDGLFRARHGMTSAQYQDEWEQATDDGFRTSVVTGYDAGQRAHYAAIWDK